MTEETNRPRIRKGDVVVYANGIVQRPEGQWLRALNGIDKDAYGIIAIYREPLWRQPCPRRHRHSCANCGSG